MSHRNRLSLLAALPIACSLIAAPVSASDEQGSLHDTRDAQNRDGRDQLNAQHAASHYLFHSEQGDDGDVSRGLASYKRLRDEEEKQARLDIERQDSREAGRYYWWWPFTR
jgi:hypothetical protein